MKPCPLLPVNSSWSGFYTLEGSSGGWEPWHSSGAENGPLSVYISKLSHALIEETRPFKLLVVM